MLKSMRNQYLQQRNQVIRQRFNELYASSKKPIMQIYSDLGYVFGLSEERVRHILMQHK